MMCVYDAKTKSDDQSEKEEKWRKFFSIGGDLGAKNTSTDM